MPIASRFALWWAVVALVVALAAAPGASAQLVLPFVPELDDLPINPFNYAGFVDGAVPLSFVRMRVDSAYDNNRPTRSEFFMPAEGRGFRGLPLPERGVDYQEIHTYAEYAFSPIVSAFIDAPTRFLDPVVNRNHAGFGDLQVGVKYSFLQQGPFFASSQLRVYFPTGDADKGLGTGHASAEPGLLLLYQDDPKWRVESELQVLIPIDDEKYGGEVLRYGSAFSYGERNPEGPWATPVVEGQGYSFIRGNETVVLPNGTARIQHATGAAVVNGNVGLRAGWGFRGDLYLGYSRPLTGDVLYKEMYRLELRWFY